MRGVDEEVCGNVSIGHLLGTDDDGDEDGDSSILTFSKLSVNITINKVIIM